MSDRYTLTVKFAPYGTKYINQDGSVSSSIGHVWLEANGSNDKEPFSRGWATGESSFSCGEDNIMTEDWKRYQGNNISSITVEINKEQYDRIRTYADRAASGKIPDFRAKTPHQFLHSEACYDLLTNSCIDFSGLGLADIGLADKGFDGKAASPYNQLGAFLEQVAKHRAKGADLEVEYQGQKYHFKPDERDIKQFRKHFDLSLSMNIGEENKNQYALHTPSLHIENMPEDAQKIYHSIENNLTAYYQKNGLSIDEDRLKNAAMALTSLGYSKRMEDAPLFNIKEGNFLIGERNPVLIRASMDVNQALSTPLEESIGRVRQTEIRFQQEEMERQLAQSQSRGMGLS